MKLRQVVGWRGGEVVPRVFSPPRQVTTSQPKVLPPASCVPSSFRGHCLSPYPVVGSQVPASRGDPMFAVRTARVFGLALALCFFSGGFSSTTIAQEKKDAKDAKKAKSKLKITVPQEDAELQIEGKATKPTGVV